MTRDGEEKEQVGVVSVYEIEKKKDWCQSLINYLRYSKLPKDPLHKT